MGQEKRFFGLLSVFSETRERNWARSYQTEQQSSCFLNILLLELKMSIGTANFTLVRNHFPLASINFSILKRQVKHLLNNKILLSNTGLHCKYAVVLPSASSQVMVCTT